MTKKLKNSPLVYVLMQVNISPIMSISKYIPDLQDEIRKDFPDSQEFALQVFNFMPGHPTPVERIQQWYFRDKNLSTGIIVDANNVFIHTTNYSTFNEVLEKYASILIKFNEIANISSCNRLGIRYINVIPASEGQVQDKLLGFHLLDIENIEDQYITKTETIQKTKVGTVKIKASTFNDRNNEYTIGKCIPPDLMETANKLVFQANKSFDGKFTVLDIDHYTSGKQPEDFDCKEIKRKLHILHDTVKIVFESAVTEKALQEWR